MFVSKPNTAPLFKHDCDTCTFLGTVDGHDLYCHAGDNPTVIARWSSDGPDYKSGIMFIPFSPLLGEAYRRAVERGLLSS